jgi:hypothetical protein
MKRVKIIRTPAKHGLGRDGKRVTPCTCRGLTGTLVSVFDDGTAVVRLDRGGRVGLPFACLKEL